MGFLKDFFDGHPDDTSSCGRGADSFLSFRDTLQEDWPVTEEPRVYSWKVSRSGQSDERFRPLELPLAIRLSSEEGGDRTNRRSGRSRIGRQGDQRERSGSWDTLPGVTTELHEGYRLRTYRDSRQRLEIPVLVAAVSASRLLPTFLDLSDFLGATVDLVLETSHGEAPSERRNYLREQIDLPVLQSILWEYGELLTNDGRMGLAILASDRPLELQFDDHKLIYVYTHHPDPFESYLRAAGIPEDGQLEVVTERSHCHGSSREYGEEFDRLVQRVGATDPDVSDDFPA
ncbi:MAG: hypothetical protein Q4C47_03035 [Planctomycetia bacterium]|nr:hypothetical protein [Planctomycetia bacterium]